MDVHIGFFLAKFLVFEIVAFLLASTITIIKWVRYYRNPFFRGGIQVNSIRSGWAVAMGEGRITTALFFSVFNVLGAGFFIGRFLLHVFDVHLSW